MRVSLRRLPMILWGGLLPIAPLGGPNCFLLISCLTLIAYLRLAANSPPILMLPYLAVLAAWTFVQGLAQFDLDLLLMLARGEDGSHAGGLLHVLEYLWYAPPPGLSQLFGFLHWLVYSWLFVLFVRRPSLRESAVRGVAFGLIPAALVSALQVSGALPFELPRQTPYWTSLGQFTGTLSDPNAFGLLAALLLPIFAARLKRLPLGRARFVMGLSAVWLILGCFSGSRTYIAGLVLYAFAWLWIKQRKAAMWSALAAGILLLMWNGAVLQWPEIRTAAEAALPKGPARVLNTLTVCSASDALFSRSAFGIAALRMWQDNPVWGVGFAGFAAALPQYSAGLGLGLWIDNANNFYLGVLAETGLLGALALILSILNLRSKNAPLVTAAEGRVLRAAVAVFGVLLLSGPHLNFPEIAGLFALLAAHIFAPKRAAGHAAWLGLLFLAAAAIGACLGLADLERGLYPYEQAGQGAFRWTRREARIEVCCRQSQGAKILIRALTPGIEEIPLRVKVRHPNNSRQELELINSNAVEVPLQCEASGPAMAVISSSRVWMPQEYGGSSDRRVLGVQVSVPAGGRCGESTG